MYRHHYFGFFPYIYIMYSLNFFLIFLSSPYRLIYPLSSMYNIYIYVYRLRKYTYTVRQIYAPRFCSVYTSAQSLFSCSIDVKCTQSIYIYACVCMHVNIYRAWDMRRGFLSLGCIQQHTFYILRYIYIFIRHSNMALVLHFPL